MHRSGTSLTTSLLQSAGVDIGNELLEAHASNPNGHYEDVNFLQFHQDILDALGIQTTGWTVNSLIDIPEVYTSKATELVNQHSEKHLWGWKDPRTVLFLHFWKQVIPNVKFIFVYRNPWDVVDSLYRRGTDTTFIKNPNFAVDVWRHYNQLILDCYTSYPDECILFNIDSITQNPAILTKGIHEKLHIQLDSPKTTVYDETLFNHDNSHHALLIKTYFPDAISLYNQLVDHSYALSQDDRIISEASNLVTGSKSWITQDWLNYRIIEASFKTLETEHTHLHHKLVQINQEFNDTTLKQEQTYTVFEQKIQSLEHELLQERLTQDQLKKELHNNQIHLDNTHAMLEECKMVIHDMEHSVFWKLRTTWLRITDFFRKKSKHI
jgi:hypothetical protein